MSPALNRIRRFVLTVPTIIAVLFFPLFYILPQRLYPFPAPTSSDASLAQIRQNGTATEQAIRKQVFATWVIAGMMVVFVVIPTMFIEIYLKKQEDRAA